MKIGADPEVFLVMGSDIISSSKILEGTKDCPEPLEEGYFIQKDNILAEFNVPPASSREEFINNITKGIELVKKRVAPADIKISPFERVSEEVLSTPDAAKFGCDPDFIVYNGNKERRITIKDNSRSAGGHVHISFDNVTIKKCQEVIKACDLFIGLPSLLLDDSIERRSMYGQAGCYRIKDYGVEYRSPSNFWLKDKALIGWIYDSAEKALQFVEQGNSVDMSSEGRIIPDAINASDKAVANYYINKYQIKFPHVETIKVK